MKMYILFIIDYIQKVITNSSKSEDIIKRNKRNLSTSRFKVSLKSNEISEGSEGNKSDIKDDNSNENNVSNLYSTYANNNNINNNNISLPDNHLTQSFIPSTEPSPDSHTPLIQRSKPINLDPNSTIIPPISPNSK